VLGECIEDDATCAEEAQDTRADARVREERVVIAEVLGNAGLGVLVTDANDVITETNAMVRSMLGYQQAELVGVSYPDLVYLDDTYADSEKLAALAEGSATGYVHKLRLIRKEGSPMWALVHAALLPAGSRDRGAVVVRFIEDIAIAGQGNGGLRDEDAAVKRAYADVIAAVTGDRLLLLTRPEVEDRLGEIVQQCDYVRHPKELTGIRARTKATLARSFSRLPAPDDLLLAVTEALTNALRHAGAGEFEVRRVGTRAQCVIRDSGPGIDFGSLPRATLTTGYSTKPPSLGAGFTIMLETCDSVLLHTGPEGTTVVLQMDQAAASS